MWKWLQRHQEGLLVGTSVSLVVLALLLHGRSLVIGKLSQPQDGIAKKTGPVFDLSSDDAFYADKWRQIASEFYAAHPVLDGSPSNGVVAVSLNDTVPSQTVIAASHTSPVAETVALEPIERMPAASLPSKPTPIGAPAVASAIAAGILAFLLFQASWPISHSPHPSRIIPLRQTFEDELRLELPSEWVHIRPTLKQRLRPIVLSTASISATVAAWSIVVH